MSSEEKDDEMICALTADERDVLIRGLNDLPETMPPRIVWDRIREQAEAEGLIHTKPMQKPSNWMAGVGIAAAVVLAVLVVPKILQDSTPSTNEVLTTNVEEPNAHFNPPTALRALMVESSQLENDLRALPSEPKVIRAGTAATISELQDSIAAIDFQLSDPTMDLTAEEQELFWRERVRLMKILVRLRYAQAQRTAF